MIVRSRNGFMPSVASFGQKLFLELKVTNRLLKAFFLLIDSLISNSLVEIKTSTFEKLLLGH